MGIQVIGWKLPGPTGQNGMFVPVGTRLPKMRGRGKLDLRAEIAHLDDAIAELVAMPCTFWACEGPQHPVYMLTCNKCWTVRNLVAVRETLARQLPKEITNA